MILWQGSFTSVLKGLGQDLGQFFDPSTLGLQLKFNVKCPNTVDKLIFFNKVNTVVITIIQFANFAFLG